MGIKDGKKPFWKKKRVKFGIPLLLVLVIGVIAYQIGMKYASEKVVNQISTQIPKSEISSLLKDPSIQKMIEDEVGTEKKQEILKKFAVDPSESTTTAQNPNSTTKNGQAVPTNKPVTASTKPNDQKDSTKTNTNTQKDTQPAGQKDTSNLQFKTQQDVLNFLLTKFTMSELLQFASQANGGVTEEEKTEIKSKVLSRLSDREYQAIKVFAIMQLSK